MGKLKLTLVLITALLFVMTGCAYPNNPYDIAKEYKENLYNVPNYEVYEKYINDTDLKNQAEFDKQINDTFSKYFSQDGYENFIASRRPYMYHEAAYNGRFSMELMDIVLEKTGEDESVPAYNYTASIKLTFEDGSTENAAETGQIVFRKENGAWKIVTDKITDNPFLEYLGVKKE